MSYETSYVVEGGDMSGAAAGVLAGLLGFLAIIWLVAMIVSVVCIIAQWKMFKKAGRPGWAAIVPFYNTYTLFDVVYGNGIKFLFLLIPLFNIYVMIKLYIDLARVYGKSVGFGLGLLFLSPIFLCILGFGDAQYVGDVNGCSAIARPVKQDVEVPSSEMSEEDMRAALRKKMQNR